MPRGPDPDVSDRRILLYMVQSPDPAFGANEIADEFGNTRQWADRRLRKMEDSGLLNSKNHGGSAKFYWPSESGKEYLHKTRD